MDSRFLLDSLLVMLLLLEVVFVEVLLLLVVMEVVEVVVMVLAVQLPVVEDVFIEGVSASCKQQSNSY